jgi:hypothetical protein
VPNRREGNTDALGGFGVRDDRFFMPTAGRSGIEIFRAFRAVMEKKAEVMGRTLDPAWYDDGPNKLPELYGLKEIDDDAAAT